MRNIKLSMKQKEIELALVGFSEMSAKLVMASPMVKAAIKENNNSGEQIDKHGHECNNDTDSRTR